MTATYRYLAARPDGRMERGVVRAQTARDASAALTTRRLHPVRVSEIPSTSRARNVSRQELAVVFRSLAALVGAGVPVDRAVAATQPLARGRLAAALSECLQQLREGRTLAGALGETEMVPVVVTGILRAGERGSRLGSALEQAASHLEQEAELAARVRQALAYPMLLAVTGTASVLLIGTVVVPRFASMLGELGQDLPATTRLLLDASAVATRHGLLLGASSAAILVALVAAIRRPEGELRWHRALLRIPMIRPIRHALASARICRSLGGLLAAGLPIIAALDAAREAGADRAVGERMVRARDRISGGESISASLARENVLVPFALELVSVGESSGQLAIMAERAGAVAGREAERALRTATTLIEPVMVIGFGAVVALVAAALLQAVYSLRAA